MTIGRWARKRERERESSSPAIPLDDPCHLLAIVIRCLGEWEGMERERASLAVLVRYHCRRPSLHIVILPYMLSLLSFVGHLTCGGLTVVIWWGPHWSLVIPCIHHHHPSLYVEGGQGGHPQGVIVIVSYRSSCEVGESIVVIRPPHPCIVVSHCRRWVRASGSVFEVNRKGCGGKVSTRELLSLSLSLSAGHLTCGGLAIIVWWGPCRLSVIGHPPLHLLSLSIIVVVAHGGKVREVGDIVHSPR